jgi:TolA-binding protein
VRQLVPPSLDTAVSAFRDLTAEPAEGAATRARVLARAERQARRRGLARPVLAALVVTAVIFSSGVALTAAGLRWRAQPPAQLTEPAGDTPGARHAQRASRALRVVPPAREDVSAPAPRSDRADQERFAYERAHHAHFFADAPARALAAWDQYLATYPHGTFAPEARYNRALCLVRLGKFEPAATALRPFAAGRVGGYRRHEACLLLRWLSEQDAGIESASLCD